MRSSELDPDSATYGTHVDVWARHKDHLNKCLSKFNDRGCGPDDWPSGFDPSRAEAEARRPAPDVTGAPDFINRGGAVPVAIGVFTLSWLGAMAGFLAWLDSIPVGRAGRVVASLPEICSPEECPEGYK